jgi:hypothetical protein
MNKINSTSIDKSAFSHINPEHTKKDAATSHSALLMQKQEMHEQKVDEFFYTDTKYKKDRHSPIAAVCSIIGVLTPLVMIGKKQAKIKYPDLQLKTIKDYFKNAGKIYNIEYNGAKEIIALGLGGVIGGLIGGLVDRKEPEKLQKLEEAVFQTMNVSFPALLISTSNKLLKKSSKLKGGWLKTTKLIASAGCLMIGSSAAVKIANKADDKFFDKYYKDEERKFKKKDLLVHFDDLVGAMVLAKIPGVHKLGLALPAIFSWSGYHVGDS